MSKQIKIDNFNYKKIKVLAPFCPICGKQVFGDSSLIHPYHCECGEWKFEWDDEGYHYTLIKK